MKNGKTMIKVTFIEAIKALCRRDTIVCKLEGETKEYSNYWNVNRCIVSNKKGDGIYTLGERGEALSANEILNGQWFIKR